MAVIKASFPQLGSYHIPLEVLFRAGFEVEYIAPPPINKRTLAVGSLHSPDFVCTPFKYSLGNFIETIEAGADTIVQTGGVCRLRYYGELQEQILRDLGFKVNFINIARAQSSRASAIYHEVKKINPAMSLKKVAAILPVVFKMVKYIDEVEDYVRKNVGFEKESGSFDRVLKSFFRELPVVRGRKELNKIYRRHKKLLKEVKVDKPSNPLKVGIVGEYYTIMEPFSNHYLEKELARMGIIVDRWLNVTNTLLHREGKKMKERVKDYAKYPMGATSIMTIDRALKFAKKGFDGIIHVKSFGCTPEVDAVPVLQNISNDYKIPVLYLSFDTQTGEAGLYTRLEAFHDMILMRKEAG